MLLTPIVSVLFQVLVAQTGRTVLADEDILQFVLEPLGWVCMVLVGALSIAIMALEQVALMSIICAADHDRRLSVTGCFAICRGQCLARVACGRCASSSSRSWRWPRFSRPRDWCIGPC